jgi:phosphoribosyl 1,2-cyclic phosphate phosphodiesterase
MRLTFLGTGTSQGVPMIGCACAVCRSTDPKDQRLRSSVWLQDEGFSILIDTTPDLRFQALRAGMDRLDAVVCTHAHNDHLIGFDDLRRFCEASDDPLPVYGSAETHQRLMSVFPYAFESNPMFKSYVRAQAHLFEGSFDLGPLRFHPVKVPHGRMLTHGFVIEKQGRRLAAYIPDCAEVTEEVASQLQNLPILIIDGLRDKPHPTHLTLAQAMEAGKKVNAGKIYLTHLTHDISHAQRQPLLPQNVCLAYDGLVLECPL